MRIIMLLLLCFALFPVISVADNLSSEFSKFEQKDKTVEKFEYKSKPKTSYHSNGPTKDDLGLERLKPILNQMSGEKQDGTASGVVPNATMSF